MHALRATNSPPVIGAGVGTGARVAATLLLSANFAAQSEGAFTAWPSGLTYSRASTINVPTGNGQTYAMGIASGQGAIADYLGARGLLHCRGFTNKITNSRSTTGWVAAGGGATSTGGQSGSPDGTSNVIRHVVPSGGYSAFPTYAVTIGHTYTAWCVMRPAASTSAQINHFDNTNHSVGYTLTSGWQVAQKTITAALTTTGGFIPADGRDGTSGGGVAAGARNCDTDMHVAAEVPYALVYHATTLAPSALSTTTLDGWGRFRVRLKVTWLCASSQLVDDPTLWYVDALDYAEIDAAGLTIRVVIDGFAIRLSLSGVGLATWTAGTTHEFSIDAGNGPPTGWVAVNGGARTSFDATLVRHGAFYANGVTVYLLSRSGTSQHLDAEVQSLDIYGLSVEPTTTRLYMSPSGSGDGLSAGSPASLGTAISLAAARLAAGERVRLYVTASGTFLVGSGLSWTDGSLNGLTIAPLTASVAYTFSGAVDATTGWTVDAGSRYRRAFPAGASGRLQLTAAGTRATVASTAITTGGLSGWSRSVTGWTASAGNAATIAAYAQPAEVEVIARSNVARWKQALLPISSIVGTAITCNASDIAAADFQGGYGGPYTIDNAVGWRGVKELVAAGTFVAEQATSTLYYQPRGGETMNTTTITVAATEHILTIESAANITIIGATFADTKWDRATTSRSGNAYPYGGGGGGGYIPLVDGVCGGVGGDYWTIPAAVTVRASTGIYFQSCTFTRLGGDGLAFERGAQNSGHRGCTFTDISGHAERRGYVMPVDQRPATEADTPSDLWAWSSSASNCCTEYPDCGQFATWMVRRYRTYYCVSSGAPWSGFDFGWGWGFADPGGGGWPQGFTTDPTTPTINAGGVVGYCLASSSGATFSDGGGFYFPGSQNTATATYLCAPNGNNVSIYLDNGCTAITVSDSYGRANYTVQSMTPIAYGNTLLNCIGGGGISGDLLPGTNNTYTNFRTITYTPVTDPAALSIIALAGLA